MSSRPTIPQPSPTENNNGFKEVLVGYAYFESYNPRGARVYVPGHKEDYLIPHTPSFNSTTLLDQWIKFRIFTETKKLDPEGPMTVVAPPKTSAKGTIRLMCESVDGVIRTVGDGHLVKDPDNELAARGKTGNFLLELRLQAKGGLPNKPTFIVDKQQPQLGPRLVPRELPKPQPQQPLQRYPTRNHNQGRNQNQVPANNSELPLPRHLRPQTCSATRPRPVFHDENNSNPGHRSPPQAPPHHQQYSPPRSYEDHRPRGYTDEFSSSLPGSGRSSASSPEQRSPPRRSPQSHDNSNYTHTRGNRQPTHEDMMLADTVRDLLREPQFREMLIYNCPEVCSRLLTLV
ncbi:hypothetical protein CAEBREN_20060 [Caenorhabditis brenneri]|uniref:Uncharacterized protein n=1 Tax=Caenorhabditis brenneri TaxID=135651 RepID=G0NDH7_CAEBE|nr:hypothetical protein CAEBREN_20060 [Caenorhabditis brenneri]